MRLSLQTRNIIKEGISQLMHESFVKGQFDVTRKADFSFVTNVDIAISNLVKDVLNRANTCFFSEEEQNEYYLPAYILDPIDGTRELVQGIPECCLSLAYLEKDEQTGEGWIYNPFTGFEMHNGQQFCLESNIKAKNLLGLVSQSEWNKGLYGQIKNPNLMISPRGSIAFKLGLLAAGSCDFVITKRPKNIWDIAAGTLLLWERGYKFYQSGKEVKTLSQQTYMNDLIWCKHEHFEQIEEEFRV